ncbi:hypothetical protein J6N69_04995 [bacterium]|nr:hypothetical protein [bacterium]
MIKIENLPNCYNGKVYKRWTKVNSMYGDGSILASKTNSKGETVQLLLTGNGRKKELIFNDGKIADITDSKGIKRVYKYQRLDKDTIKGQMFVSADKTDKFPLLTGAKWILKNMIPEKLFLQINTKHPQSGIYIPKEGPDGTSVYTGNINKLYVKEILAKNFVGSSKPMPKTILLKTTRGETKALTKENAEDNKTIAQHFDILSDVLGENIMTIV